MRRDPVPCPTCGEPMNRHAEKPSDPRERDEAIRAATGLGITIEEVHQCPRCGAIVSRREVPT